MIVFSKFILEMARETGINTSGFYREEDLMFYLDNPKYIHKKYDNIGSKKYIVIQTGDYNFFLTNKNSEYLGHIELSDPNEDSYCSIRTSESKIKRGFYDLMFGVILQNKEIKGILSDSSLSTQAIGSYEKISKRGFYKIYVYDLITKDITNFSKKELLKNSKVVLISDEQIKGLYEKYYNSLNDHTISITGFYKNPIKRLFESTQEDKSYLDQYLCGIELSKTKEI